ncbi:YraN family protein [Brevibacillus humidisoli]|uniref:YraN family protein n=1 Tax=Brevibacillus humidisoli TaxID=2895522 RepID=UPI001E347468|nr:YraN family protein [Brevibacillus humidisoli]UFJ42094.1 YraN family protein [Brevibacillus humidisoli]
MSKARIQLGRYGEQVAAQRLVEQGYSILGRNIRFRTAELDIVAVDRGMLVFVEVRTRSGIRQGTGAESISWRKRQKLREAALCYLQQREGSGRQIRFDVICVTIAPDGSRTPVVEHIVNAF